MVVGAMWWIDRVRSQDNVSTAGLVWPVSTGPDWPDDVQRGADSVVLPVDVDADDPDVADIVTQTQLAWILDRASSQLPPDFRSLTPDEVQLREAELTQLQRERLGPLVDAVFTGSAHESQRDGLGKAVVFADYTFRVTNLNISTLSMKDGKATVKGTVTTSSSATVGVESAQTPGGTFANSPTSPFEAHLHRDGSGHWRVDRWQVQNG